MSLYRIEMNRLEDANLKFNLNPVILKFFRYLTGFMLDISKMDRELNEENNIIYHEFGDEHLNEKQREWLKENSEELYDLLVNEGFHINIPGSLLIPIEGNHKQSRLLRMMKNKNIEI